MVQNPAAHDLLTIAHIRRVLAGEAPRTPEFEAAREQLFRDSRPGLVALCTRILRDPQAGEDVAQEALEIGWRNLPRYRGDSSFASYMRGVARKRCFRRLRKKVELLDPEVLEVEDDDRTPLEQLTREERNQMIRFVAEGLSDLERRVVKLRFVEELPYEEIEHVLEIDLKERPTGVRGILFSCKRRLSKRVAMWLADHRHGLSFFQTRR